MAASITFKLKGATDPVDAIVYFDDTHCDSLPYRRCALSRRMLTEGGHKFAVTIFCKRINAGRPVYVLPSEFAARASPEAVLEELARKWEEILIRRAALDEDAKSFGLEVRLR